jgi:hypothetical protein
VHLRGRFNFSGLITLLLRANRCWVPNLASLRRGLMVLLRAWSRGDGGDPSGDDFRVAVRVVRLHAPLQRTIGLLGTYDVVSGL